jgi:zinc finger HIT domain-containing protein 1
MPLIEELPLHTPGARVQPGWAYVPTDPSTVQPLLAATQAPTARKRARLDPSSSLNTSTAASSSQHISAKQQKAIDARLRDLGRENYKDVVVPIPKRDPNDFAGATKPAAQTPTNKKSSNVRRILGYSRGFAHYLADEEAAITAGGGGFQGTWGNGVSVSAAAGVGGGAGRQGAEKTAERKDRRKSAGAHLPAKARGGRGKGASLPETEDDVLEVKVKHEVAPPVDGRTENKLDSDPTLRDGDVAMSGTDAPTTTTTTTTAAKPRSQDNTAHQQPSTQQQQPPPPRYDPALDADPLLRTLNLPPQPSARVIAALLSEPPLSYAAARATPLPPNKTLPRRHFCGVCGYWGRVRCRKCAERSCGLAECWKAHEAGCAGY